MVEEEIVVGEGAQLTRGERNEFNPLDTVVRFASGSKLKPTDESVKEPGKDQPPILQNSENVTQEMPVLMEHRLDINGKSLTLQGQEGISQERSTRLVNSGALDVSGRKECPLYVVCNQDRCVTRGIKYAAPATAQNCFNCGERYEIIAPIPDNVVFERDKRLTLIEGVVENEVHTNGVSKENSRAHYNERDENAMFRAIRDQGYLAGTITRIVKEPREINGTVFVYESDGKDGFVNLCKFYRNGKLFGDAFSKEKLEDMMKIAENLGTKGEKVTVSLRESQILVYPADSNSRTSLPLDDGERERYLAREIDDALDNSGVRTKIVSGLYGRSILFLEGMTPTKVVKKGLFGKRKFFQNNGLLVGYLAHKVDSFGDVSLSHGLPYHRIGTWVDNQNFALYTFGSKGSEILTRIVSGLTRSNGVNLRVEEFSDSEKIIPGSLVKA